MLFSMLDGLCLLIHSFSKPLLSFHFMSGMVLNATVIITNEIPPLPRGPYISALAGL